MKLQEEREIINAIHEAKESITQAARELVEERDRYRAALESICSLPERYGWRHLNGQDDVFMKYVQGQSATEAIRLAKCALRYLGETKNT